MTMELENLDLPEDWQVKSIRDVYSFTKKPRGLLLPSNGSVPFLPMEAIPIGRVRVSAFEERLGSTLTSGTYVENGDLLVAKITPSFENGKQAIVSWKEPFGFATTEVIPLQEIEGVSDKFFLFHLLLHPAIRADLAGKMDGTTGRQRLSKEVLGGHLIPLPPLAEQLKIAAVLGLVQQAIEQQEGLIALTTELKKTLLHKLFTEGLRGEPQKQTDNGPVPQSWEVVTLQNVCSFLSGGTPSKQKPEFWSGSIPWVSPKDMKKPRLSDVVDHISEAALEDGSSLAPAGSVFVVIRGMILAKDVPVALTEVPMAFNQDMKAIIPGARLVPSFLLYALVAFKQRLFQKVGRSAHGTMTLMSSEIAQFTIPLPDEHTQQEIASAIEAIERKHEQHQRKRTALTTLFRTLLHQLMTAQIRVHNLDLPELVAHNGKE
ncbi:MAG TPA: restriction endonuclease subunit S [Woeseiaceae bacterium]|nr:restriction endonuclease subunit S [Woeseiaceae bacterium]